MRAHRSDYAGAVLLRPASNLWRAVYGALVLVSVVTVAAPAGAAGSSGHRGSGPVPAYNGDFPDPDVLWTGQAYYAYSTGSSGRNLQVMSSPDMAQWTSPAEALPQLPSWASSGLTWAPSVSNFNGTYVMWYTVHDPTAGGGGEQCLSVATSSTPAGPFRDTSSGPAVCQSNGSIDPNVFVDAGSPYLLWKSDDNSVGQPTHLWAAPLARGGTSLATTTFSELLTESPDSWQAPAIEGPTMVKSGGRYYLFYGAGDWSSPSAGIGYATCSSPTGSCTDRSATGPWDSSNGSALGPSGPTAFVDQSGISRLAYHAWYTCVGYSSGCHRALYIGRLSFSRSGRPLLGT